MNSFEKKLLIELQNNFPSSETPYKDLSEKLGVPEEQILDTVKELKKQKYIRRIGGILNSKEIGYHSELCAVKIPAENIEQCALIINESSLVTHNYQRENEFSLWFTFCEKKELFEDSLKKLENKIEANIYRLPTKKLFKTKVILDFKHE
ncbi:MAG: Lrp/AsnC family transcriptional regulator [Caldisericia bacterium]|nr:Lrp/AsnC family transcriptional regulator [Caldisericia bacterium]